MTYRRSVRVLVAGLVALASGPLAAQRSEGPRTVGTAHPYTFRAADPGGRWVVLCQARSDTDGDGSIAVKSGYHGELWGDRMQMYLVRGRGEGVPIDDLVGTSPSGRWLAIETRGSLELLDITKSKRRLLETGDSTSRIAARFSSDGRRLVYSRGTDAGTRLVSRDLRTQREKVLDPGPGLLWDFELPTGSPYVVAYTVTKDTDGDGRVALPRVITTRAKNACGVARSSSTMGLSGDEPEAHIVPLSGARWSQVGGFAIAFGKHWLSEVGGALVLHRKEGGSAELVPNGACPDPWLIHGDPEKERLLLACKKPRDYAWEIRAYDPEGMRVVVADAHGGSVDEEPINRSRVAQYIRREMGGGWIDLVTMKAFPNDEVVWRDGNRLLVRRDGSIQVVDADTGRASKVVDARSIYGVDEQAGDLVFSRPWIIDLRRARLIGRVDGAIHALASDGSVLLGPNAGCRSEREPGPEPPPLPRGPLHWTRPAPPTAPTSCPLLGD